MFPGLSVNPIPLQPWPPVSHPARRLALASAFYSSLIACSCLRRGLARPKGTEALNSWGPQVKPEDLSFDLAQSLAHDPGFQCFWAAALHFCHKPVYSAYNLTGLPRSTWWGLGPFPSSQQASACTSSLFPVVGTKPESIWEPEPLPWRELRHRIGEVVLLFLCTNTLVLQMLEDLPHPGVPQ